MDRFLNALRREPVRLRLYTLGVLVAGYAVSRGLIAPTDADFVGAVLALVLATEGSRAKVSPV